MEIKVGDYVRSSEGLIAKIIDIEKKDNYDTLVFDKNICYLVDKETGDRIPNRLTNRLPLLEHIDISKIKHGKLIDVIEIGDYVNGLRVYEITDIETSTPVLCIYAFEWLPLKDIIIKSIVTKEQFESMEYKL